jgi:O-antigen ligase
VLGTDVQADPHNFYVTVLLRAGVVGLLAFIALTVGLLRAVWRTRPGDGGGVLTPDVFPALLAMQAVFFLTWIPGMEQGIITGLAVGLAARGRGAATVPQPRLGSYAVAGRNEGR